MQCEEKLINSYCAIFVSFVHKVIKINTKRRCHIPVRQFFRPSIRMFYLHSYPTDLYKLRYMFAVIYIAY